MAAQLVPWCRIIGIRDHVELMCGCMQSVKWYAWPMRDMDIETRICCNMGHLFSTSPSESCYGFPHAVYIYIYIYYKILRCCCTLTLVGLPLLVGAVSLACTHPRSHITWNEFIVYMAGVQCTLVKSMHGMSQEGRRGEDIIYSCFLSGI